MRVPSYTELALGIAIGGTALGALLPAFYKNLHASHLTEATQGLHDIGVGALTYAKGKDPSEAFPPPAPLTPTQVPRGTRVTDPPGTWDHLTWAALGFSVTTAHSFSFSFDSTNDPVKATFVARAHGDLDGDGDRSLFELRGECTTEGARVLPELIVEREVE